MIGEAILGRIRLIARMSPVLRSFILGGADHRSHTKQNATLAAYIRWRNARDRPKTGFATDLSIRTCTDHPIKVA
ncbi:MULTISPECIES: hypothetical protein [Actinosynnema]|uniref:hypothetical protein n=1 Tax=Actinosynnema TaxID=40566 RepID=UPI0020A450B6|nr:hypothetical protein [Actinosynnema pretiosum]MCP2099989.1 hypothetical protein [Actinosynnema pretiosum]